MPGSRLGPGGFGGAAAHSLRLAAIASPRAIAPAAAPTNAPMAKARVTQPTPISHALKIAPDCAIRVGGPGGDADERANGDGGAESSAVAHKGKRSASDDTKDGHCRRSTTSSAVAINSMARSRHPSGLSTTSLQRRSTICRACNLLAILDSGENGLITRAKSRTAFAAMVKLVLRYG